MTKQALIERITAHFPQALRALDQWVVWRLEQRQGEKKPTKIPYSAATGNKAESDNPLTWASFHAACGAFLNGSYNGVGFMFSEHDPYAGVDFDGCVAGDHVDPQALRWMRSLDSYTEFSQSGTGIHTIVLGKLPGGGRKSAKHGVEMYDNRRFFVVTGDHVAGTPADVQERQAALTALHDEIFPTKAEPQPRPQNATPAAIPADDEALIQRMFAARNGADVAALWAGNLSAYNNDESAGDLALCNHLAFWTGNDAERIDRLFRQSALMRDKWDRNARTGETYGQGTIARAIAATMATYTGQRRNGSNGHHANGHGNGIYHVNGNGQAASPDACIGDKAPQAKTPFDIQRRTYVKLLTDLRSKALKTYDERLVINCLSDSEEGDARLLHVIAGGDVVYDHAEGQWYWYNNLYWEPDKTWNIYQLTSDVLSEVYKQLSIQKHAEAIELEKAIHAADEPTQEQRDNLKKLNSISKAARARSGKLNEINEVKRVLGFASSGLRLGITGEEWDTKVTLICVQNAIIDLVSDKPVMPSPESYIRTVAPVTFDPNAKCPQWEKAILEIFDNKQDDVAYVQRLLGYAMSGECVESDFPIWYGKDGRNGKEFILERIRNVLGEKMAGVAESELLLASKAQRGKNASTEGLMALRGRRIAWASETNEGRQLDLAAMKDLSGGHVLTGRHNHGKQVEWKRTHTLILLTNHRPHVNSQALAEWDRVKLMEFPLSFVNEPDPAKPNQRKKDKTLGDRIDKDELSGVFNWLLDGQMGWRAMGLCEPESVKSATAKYRQDEDTLGHFIAEICFVGADARCKPIDLYKRYVEWSDIGSKPMGKKTFYTKIEERGFRRSESMGYEHFFGIGILSM